MQDTTPGIKLEWMRDGRESILVTKAIGGGTLIAVEDEWAEEETGYKKTDKAVIVVPDLTTLERLHDAIGMLLL